MVQETDGNGDEEGRSEKRSRTVKKKTVPLVPTKRIHQDGDAVLVEWHDGTNLRRGIIPIEARKSNDVAQDVLEAALDWGDDFTQVEGVTNELAAALHNSGIWTAADFLQKSHLARGAIQQVYAVPLLQRLLEFAKANK
jgi:hypothetical protein